MVAAIEISPDGKRLAAAGSVTRVGGSHGLPGGFVVIWDAQTGQELHRFDRLSTRADAVTFGRDGKYLAAGTQGASGELPEPGELRIWETESGRLRLSLNTKLEVKQGGDPCSVVKLAFDPEATRLAAALGDGTVRIWELPTGKVIVNQRGHEGAGTGQEIDPTGLILGPQRAVRCIAFNSDGSRLALGGYDRVVRVWDSGTGVEKHAFRFNVPRINAVAFSPDGKRLASPGGEGAIRVWDLEAKKAVLELRGHGSGVHAAAFSPDGKRIASGSKDTTVRVWDAETGEPLLVLRGHESEVYGVAFGGADRLVSFGPEIPWSSNPSTAHPS
jgi:WD40 repeat protein